MQTSGQTQSRPLCPPSLALSVGNYHGRVPVTTHGRTFVIECHHHSHVLVVELVPVKQLSSDLLGMIQQWKCLNYFNFNHCRRYSNNLLKDCMSTGGSSRVGAFGGLSPPPAHPQNSNILRVQYVRLYTAHLRWSNIHLPPPQLQNPGSVHA